MSIELFVFPISPRAFRVLAVANYLGLDYVQHTIDLISGEQRAPDYAALNPNMLMPTLKDGNYILWESHAICQYLALKAPERGLLPSDPLARIDVTRWQFWDATHWDPACAVFSFEHVVKRLLKNPTPDPEVLSRAEPAFHKVAKVLNDHLRDKPFIAGNHLTLADLTIGAALATADIAHYPLGAYDEIKRWFNELCMMPSWQKTLQSALATTDDCSSKG